jgi:AcrR family transcriptional regulator
MARPIDPQRRARTLANAADYVLEHGLEGLSLRPLAAALGTSTRMLLYDFGSKEKLVDEVLAEIRRRLAERLAELQGGRGGAATLAEVWRWVSAEERAPFMRVFFETHVHALAHPGAHAHRGRPMIDDWLRFLESRWEPEPLDPATATLFVAVIRGLLLDRLTAEDPERVDAALGRFTELLESGRQMTRASP